MTFNSTAAPELDVFVPYDGLREHGIPYTRVHLNRLMKSGKFPTSVRLSSNRIAWRLSELQVWKTNRPQGGAERSELQGNTRLRAREDAAA